jgi:hypothetical protein
MLLHILFGLLACMAIEIPETLPTANDLSLLATIPVPRTTLKPRTYVKTRYGILTEEAVVNANMIFNTSRPCIHLDNFLQIVDINCESGFVYLTFNTESNAGAAFTEWVRYNDLALLVGHERKCNGDDVGTFVVSGMVLDKALVAVQVSKSLKRSDVVTDWSLSVKHQEVNLKRRGWFNDVKSQLRKGAVALASKLNPDLTMNKTNHYDLSSNYNKTSKSANTPKIVLFEFFQYSAYCIDCYTNGSADATIEMTGRLSEVKKYDIRLKGEYFSNMNLRLIRGGWGENKLWSHLLFSMSLFPVNIPGVMALGTTY